MIPVPNTCDTPRRFDRREWGPRVGRAGATHGYARSHRHSLGPSPDHYTRDGKPTAGPRPAPAEIGPGARGPVAPQYRRAQLGRDQEVACWQYRLLGIVLTPRPSDRATVTGRTSTRGSLPASPPALPTARAWPPPGSF